MIKESESDGGHKQNNAGEKHIDSVGRTLFQAHT